MAPAIFVASLGCDGDETAPTTTANGGGGSGGAGGNATGGGDGGTGGTGGSGGGAPVVECLADTEYAFVFTITEKSLCVVEKHVAPFFVGFDAAFNELGPSWGRHGGPLTLTQDGSKISLSRWKASGDALSPLVLLPSTGPVELGIAATEYVNRVAVDLPFSEWTAVSWARFGAPAGELVLLASDKLDKRFDVEGLFTLAGIAGDKTNRIVHASLSAMAAPGAAKVGLYTADFCGTALCPMGAAETHVEGDASGPVAVDLDGNVFAMFPNLANATQTLRAYPALAIAPGATNPAGVEFFEMPGAGAALAALAPKGDSPGYVFLQPTIAFDYKNMVVQRFKIAAGMTGELVTDGVAHDALIPTKANTELRIFTDDAGRLWVGIGTDPMKGESTFFVLDRAP